MKFKLLTIFFIYCTKSIAKVELIMTTITIANRLEVIISKYKEKEENESRNIVSCIFDKANFCKNVDAHVFELYI